MNQQLEHHEIKREPIRNEIVIIAEHLTHAENYGGLIRTAEAFGVKEIIFISNEFHQLTPKMKRLSRSAEQYIQFKFEEDIQDCMKDYRDKGFDFVALELTNQSIPIQQYTSTNNKLGLIIGNENYGLSDSTLNSIKTTIKIPVYGTTSSLNVVVATGIALNHLAAL